MVIHDMAPVNLRESSVPDTRVGLQGKIQQLMKLSYVNELYPELQ